MKRITQFLLIFLLLTGSAQLFAQKYNVNRVDPPSWWVGMKNPHLQLLVFGPKISETTPVISYPGVILHDVIHVESPDYLFLDLIIQPDAQPGTLQINFMKGKKKETTYSYALNKRDSNPKLHQGFNGSDVVYLLMPDRFANGNPGNDNMPGMLEKANRKDPNGRHGGDIQGIEDHLNYLKNLGVTAIWSTPLLENNMPSYSYHGYAITDYYKVDPRYGTNADYKKLVEEAHSKGLKIIMDMVFNHCGTNYFWKDDLPTHDWYNQWPEFTRSNYHGGTVSDPHASEYDYKHMVAGWFDHTMADLNQDNPLVANYLIQNSIWWVEYAGLDGIRQDTYPYPYKDMMAEWMKRLLQEYPHINVVGEAWFDYPATVAYWLQNKTNKDGYQSHLTNVFDFPLCFAIDKAFNEKPGWNTGTAQLYNVLSQDFVYSDPQKLCIFGDNHDMSRIFSSLKENVKSWKMAMAFLMTTRGVPFIYYGDEILLTGSKSQGDGVMRNDFPGGWPGDPKDAFTAAGRTPEQNDAFDFLRKLLNWRKTDSTVQYGNLVHYIPENGVYVYFRAYHGKKVMVLLNNNNDKDVTVALNRFAHDMKGFHHATSVMTGKQFELQNTLTVPAKSPVILELEK
ncbi:MAG: glycoside hydrolase family 13 protein [Bacteroidales bacterium]|nr:glycoside hydrolase family 13 protein [Bacteroidales bacterium]